MNTAAKSAFFLGCLAVASGLAAETSAPKLHTDPFKAPELNNAAASPVRDAGRVHREDWRPER